MNRRTIFLARLVQIEVSPASPNSADEPQFGNAGAEGSLEVPEAEVLAQCGNDAPGEEQQDDHTEGRDEPPIAYHRGGST